MGAVLIEVIEPAEAQDYLVHLNKEAGDNIILIKTVDQTP